MSTKHTPGPWTTDNIGHGVRIEPSIAWVGFGTSKKWSEHEANAQLIASAPDLLARHNAILNYALDILCQINADHPAFNFVKAIHNEARAAIAKATSAE